MKKYFLIAVVALVLLVGCGNKNQVTCTASMSEGGISMKVSVIADLDSDNKVTKVAYEYDFGDSKTAEQYCSLIQLSYKDAQCSGSKITIPDATSMLEESGQKVVGMTKDEFVKFAQSESTGVTCK